jgi:hypothetical protein
MADELAVCLNLVGVIIRICSEDDILEDPGCLGLLLRVE